MYPESDFKLIDPAGLIQKFIDALAQESLGGERPAWTRAIKKTLINLAEQHPKPPNSGCKAWPKYEGDQFRGEWLLDVIWEAYPGEKESRYILGVESELESETGKVEDVLYDFEKLIYFKSPFKLFIHVSPEKEEDHMEIHRAIRDDYLGQSRYLIQGETYIFCEFCKLQEGATVYPYIFSVTDQRRNVVRYKYLTGITSDYWSVAEKLCNHAEG